MATATTKKKIERAYTPKDLESENLECILSHQLNKDIYSIDDGDLGDKDNITVPVGAQLNQSWAKGTELERAFSKHSATLSSEFEKVVTEAKEGTQEALTVPLQKYINDVCNTTYQNSVYSSCSIHRVKHCMQLVLDFILKKRIYNLH